MASNGRRQIILIPDASQPEWEYARGFYELGSIGTQDRKHRVLCSNENRRKNVGLGNVGTGLGDKRQVSVPVKGS